MARLNASVLTGTSGLDLSPSIPPGATLDVANVSPVALTTRTLENGGTVLSTGSGNFNLSGAVITNRAGALFQTRGLGSFACNGLGGSRFDNAGTFRKSVNSGTTTFAGNVALNNYHTVEVLNGILAANGGYASTANSLLSCAVGGTTVGTGYGRLQVAGAVTLSGTLSVSLAGGFIPTTNDTFTVLTAGTRNGTFRDFYCLSNLLSGSTFLAGRSRCIRCRCEEPPVKPGPLWRSGRAGPRARA